ncbi:MAG: DUF1002 domain-containing protein [Euryarchaeota archaeon]|nr:DUF1002 domain-containing protein [Euryarchaeota archaeon]
MRRWIIIILLILFIANTVYGTSGFAITLGEATDANSAWKDSIMNYFKSHTDKDVKSATTKIITAAEVNSISKNVTGKTYSSDQVVSCAMVDLGYDQGIKIIVDKNKIKVVTAKMYANALKSSGIENGYVVVSSPVESSGEAALAGVLKSYEIAVGANIPEEAKKAAIEELYAETQIVNQTGQDPDKIAELFEKVKNETQAKNLQDAAQIKIIVLNIAASMNINLTDQQAQQIANAVANSQKAQSSLTEFKTQLQNVTKEMFQAGDIWTQIMNYLQWIVDYIKQLIYGQK